MQAKNKRTITVVHTEHLASKLYRKKFFLKLSERFLYPPFPVLYSLTAPYGELVFPSPQLPSGSNRPLCEDSSQTKIELSGPIPSSHFLPW